MNLADQTPLKMFKYMGWLICVIRAETGALTVGIWKLIF